MHHKRAAARRIGADAWQARGHRFEGDVTEGLGFAREQKDVGRGIGLGEFVPRQETREDGLRQLTLQCGAFGTVAHDQAAMGNAARFQPPQRRDQGVELLFAHQPRDKRDDELVLADAVFCAPDA